jgi:hypothetical protein
VPRVEAEVGRVLRFEPNANYLMFQVCDPGAEEGLPDPDTWNNSADEWRIGPERCGIAVGTARCDYVPVLLELRAQPPAGSFDDVDHVVEADIELPTGKLAISGWLQQPSEVEPVLFKPGRYRLRVSYAQTQYRPPASNEAEFGDHLEYRIEMWPVQVPTEVRVLKQGRARWAL